MRVVSDLKTPLGALLKAASTKGVFIEAGKHKQYVMMPLNDDLIDFLLERSPRLIKECRDIHKQMKAGKFKTHAQVKRMFRSDARGRAAAK